MDDEGEYLAGAVGPWPDCGIEVTEVENPVVATLFDPAGGVLTEVRERRTVPFGFTV